MSTKEDLFAEVLAQSNPDNEGRFNVKAISRAVVKAIEVALTITPEEIIRAVEEEEGWKVFSDSIEVSRYGSYRAGKLSIAMHYRATGSFLISIGVATSDTQGDATTAPWVNFKDLIRLPTPHNFFDVVIDTIDNEYHTRLYACHWQLSCGPLSDSGTYIVMS